LSESVSRRKYIAVAGAAAAAAVVGGAAYYLTMPGPTPTPAPTPKPTATPKPTPAPTPKPGKITIWWNLGYYAEEKLATVEAIDKFEKETGVEVDITYIGTDELRDKLLAAIKAGTPPDMTFTMWDIVLGPLWAWKDLLVDVSDIVQENKEQYIPGMDKMAYWYNATEKKWAYYGVPFHSNCNFITVWTDLMETAGMPLDDLPTDWDGYWKYFCDIQDKLEAKGVTSDGLKIYGLGLCVGTVFDPIFASEEFYPAFDVEILKEDGSLNTSDPNVKKGLAEYLAWLDGLYDAGYIPPGATAWADPDNNMAFHSRTIVLVMNNTMSIPGYQYGYSKDNYYKKTATILKPDTGPHGKSWPTTARAESFMIFKSSPNIETCKDFIRFFIKDENLLPWLKGSHGRYFPVFKSQMEDPFYHDPEDPHIPNAAKYFTRWGVRKWPAFVNPAYAEVVGNALQSKMIGRVLVDNWSPEDAAEEFINEVNKIFEAWKP